MSHRKQIYWFGLVNNKEKTGAVCKLRIKEYCQCIKNIVYNCITLYKKMKLVYIIQKY